MWDGSSVHAAALDTPMRFIDALRAQMTQIIPLEVIAAVGLLETYGERL